VQLPESAHGIPYLHFADLQLAWKPVKHCLSDTHIVKLQHNASKLQSLGMVEHENQVKVQTLQNQ
jgi:hypothetical protein